MTAFTHLYNQLPRKQTKDVMFSVRIDDSLHKGVLTFAQLEGECRAVAFARLAEAGLHAWAESKGISLNSSNIDEFLCEVGLMEKEANNKK